MSNVQAPSVFQTQGSQANSFNGAVSSNLSSYQDFFSSVNIDFAIAPNKINPYNRILEMYKITDKPRNSGKFENLELFSKEKYAYVKQEGQSTTVLQAGTTWGITIQPTRFGLSFDLTWEADNYGKYPDIISDVRSLGTNLMNTVMLECSNNISFGLNPSFVNKSGLLRNIRTGAGQPLFSTTQPYKFDTRTSSNILPAQQFSRTSLEAMENLIFQTNNNDFFESTNGDVDYNVLWVCDDSRTLNAVGELLHSTSIITPTSVYAGFQNQGVINVYNNDSVDELRFTKQYRVFRLPQVCMDQFGSYDITKRGWWGVAAINNNQRDANSAQGHLIFWERPTLRDPLTYPSLMKADEGVMKFNGTVAFGTGWTTWQNMYVCPYAG